MDANERSLNRILYNRVRAVTEQAQKVLMVIEEAVDEFVSKIVKGVKFRNQVLPARGILADKSIIMCCPYGAIEN